MTYLHQQGLINDLLVARSPRRTTICGNHPMMSCVERELSRNFDGDNRSVRFRRRYNTRGHGYNIEQTATVLRRIQERLPKEYAAN